jgi:hypothetical protein
MAIYQSQGLPIFLGLDRAVQRGSGDLERPANLRNRMSVIVEILGNSELFAGESFGSARLFVLWLWLPLALLLSVL